MSAAASRGRAACRLLIAAFAVMADPASAEWDIPPVNWHGRLETQFRVTSSEEGSRSAAQTYTGELIGSSYLWQPWFGNWRTRLALSQIRVQSDRDSDGLLISGDGQLNLFHRSRFPVELFFNVQDTRVDFEASDISTDTRYTQLGLNHRYTNPGGDLSYQMALLHDIQEDFALGSRENGNRAILNGQLIRGSHNLSASGFFSQRQRDVGNFRQMDGQVNLNHSWRPGPGLSVDSSGTLGFVDADSDSGKAEGHNARLSSQVLWISSTAPLSVRGEIVAGSQRVLSARDQERALDEIRMNGSAVYYLTPQLRAQALAGVRGFFGDREEHRTFQEGRLDYISRPVPFYGFGLSWNAIGAARNETSSSDEGSGQIYLGGVGYDLNRVWLQDWGVPVSLGFNAGQQVNLEEDTRLGSLARLLTRASVNANTASTSGTSFFQVLGSDTREWGRRENSFLILTLSGVHNHRLGRYSDFTASYNVNRLVSARKVPVLPEDEDDDELPEFCFDEDLVTEERRCGDRKLKSTDNSTSIELRYRHAQLFRVPRLRFESRLTLSAQSLSLADYRDEGGELFWDNRLYYTIGKLEVRLRAAMTKLSDAKAGNKFALLSITRWF